MMIKQRRTMFIGAFVMTALSLLFFSQNVFAYTDIGTLTEKSKMQAIKTCYESGAFKKDIVPASDYNAKTGVVKSKTAPIPITTSDASGTINCQGLINTTYGSSLPSASDTKGIINYLKDLGYTKSKSGTDAKVCFYYTLGSNKRTNSICVFYDADGNLDSNTLTINGDDEGSNYLITSSAIDRNWIEFYDLNQPNGWDNGISLFTIADKGELTKSHLESEVASAASKITGVSNVKGHVESTGTDISDTYSMNDASAAAAQFLTKKTGISGFDSEDVWYSQYEQHSYYKYYLMSYWGLSIDEDNCSKSAGADRIPFKTAPDDITYCGLKNSSGAKVAGTNLDYTVSPVRSLTTTNGWGKVANDTSLSISGAISAINALDYNSSSMAAAGEDGLGPAPCVVGEEDCGGPSGPSTGPSGSGSGSGAGSDWSLDKCYEVAGVVGWIVCPALSFMETMLTSAYDKLIEPLLMANPNNVLGSQTQQAWGYFRDFANIFFAFLLLLVILSQITGYGIDNYGIKRMLPKLILGAILINFSFLLCQLALDVANIVGSGINSMLSGIATGSTGSSFGALIGNAASTILDIAVSGGIVAGVAVATGGWTFLLPVLLAFITAVISILFMFVLLGVRQAGIIVLAVVAPVALVLYVLPNTQKWSQRWIQMFGGLLLAYPLIGTMVGGCHLASRVILGGNQEDFVLNLLGLMLSVVPYFFIPSLLRSSMSAMGNLGARVSGLGQRLGRGASGLAGNAIRQSGGFQAMQQREAALRAQRTQHAAARRADRVINGRGIYGALNRLPGGANRIERAKVQARQADRAQQAVEQQARDYDRLNEVVGAGPGGEPITRQMLVDQESAEAQAIKDEAAVLESGNGVADANNLTSLQQAFETELSSDNQNIARIMALKNAMETKHGKKGMDAVAATLDKGTARGEGARRVINSIASDSNYKNQARSVFKAANDARNSGGTMAAGAISSVRNNGAAVGSMKTENIGQMTDDEFNAFVSQMVNPNADIRNSAGRMAQEALDDDVIRSQLNSDQINQLETLARNTGQVSSSAALQQEQDRVFNIQQQAIDQQHQQFAFTQGVDSNGLYVAPSGWRTIHVNGGGANNNRYARDPNNPNRVYDRKTNTFRNTNGGNP